MLNQNIKGFLTLLTITGIITSVFYGYKGFVEPNLINNVELYPVEIEQVNISPKVEISGNTAEITWEVAEESGGILYTTAKQDCIQKTSNCIQLTSTVSGPKHKVNIEGLEEGKNYFYKIQIGQEEFPKEEEIFFSFAAPVYGPPIETTTVKTEETPELDPKKFQEALKNQDLTFDLNSDGKVTIADLYLVNNKSSE